MKLPRKLRIGASDFEVARRSATTMGDNAGQILYANGLIEIADDLSEHMQAEVLVHECVHGMFRVCEPVELNDGQEERFVRVFSRVLCGWLRDNPATIGELTRTLKG